MLCCSSATVLCSICHDGSCQRLVWEGPTLLIVLLLRLPQLKAAGLQLVVIPSLDLSNTRWQHMQDTNEPCMPCPSIYSVATAPAGCCTNTWLVGGWLSWHSNRLTDNCRCTGHLCYIHQNGGTALMPRCHVGVQLLLKLLPLRLGSQWMSQHQFETAWPSQWLQL